MARAISFSLAMAIFALPCRGEPPASNPETLIRLTVAPAAAPKPALRYLLLPDLREMQPGNPIQNYFKSSVEQYKFVFDKEAFERRERLLAMPLDELPAQEIEEFGRAALEQADRAARLDSPDWQILLRLKTEGIGILLPDVQNLRGIARALQARFRAEVARGQFDQGIRTAKTIFAMSRHLGDASHGHRQPGRDGDRLERHPTARGNARAARLPQPVLGTHECCRDRWSRSIRGWKASGCAFCGCSATSRRPRP